MFGQKKMTPKKVYQVVETRKHLVYAAWVKPELLMSMAEAARLAGVSLFVMRNLLDRGTLRTVIDPEEPPTPMGTPRRWVLRAEAEQLAAQRVALGLPRRDEEEETPERGD